MKTCLYDEHQSLGAKIVDFAGWQMPLFYQSALREHLWVRERTGLFDISHMAKIWVEGEQSEEFLNYLATNDVTLLKDGKAQYAVLCDDRGFAVDDVLIYRENKEKYFVVVNASNREKDLDHFLKYCQKFNVRIQPDFEGYGIIALQGPKSKGVLANLFQNLPEKFMHFTSASYQGSPVIVAQSGYTGEKGYEIYGENKPIAGLWTSLIQNPDVKPIGLAARDSLRLEMGYALYGHELSSQISPVESVASWAVKTSKEVYLGKDAHLKLRAEESKRCQKAIILEENAIARPGAKVLVNQKERGEVTSGGFSPSLKRSIALIMINGVLKDSDQISVVIRDRKVLATVIKLPFIKQS